MLSQRNLSESNEGNASALWRRITLCANRSIFACPVDDTNGETLDGGSVLWSALMMVVKTTPIQVEQRKGIAMTARWLHLGLTALLMTGTGWAQAPHSERDGGLLPPIIQVVAKEPVPLDDEEEILVEVIKAMPKLREEVRSKTPRDENFKIIKVKKESSDEPLAFLPQSKKATMTPTHDAVKSVAKSDEKNLTMFSEEQPVKIVRVPFREKVMTSWPSLPSWNWSLTSGQSAPSTATTSANSKEPVTISESCDTYCSGGQASNVGWIDSAIIGTQARVRFDSRWNNIRPDRAEFFTARNQQFFDGNVIDGRGFPIPERKIDMIEAVTYFEYAFHPRFSAFIEMPLRFMNPDQNDRGNGAGDLNVGLKVAYFMMPDQVQTFQLRIYTPTGNSEQGLGVGHATVEPALLLWQKLSDNFTLESEIRDWIPLGGTNHSGNTLRYSLGLSYDMFSSDSYSIKPVVELIGWSVLRGKESRFINSLPTFQSTHDAAGTIIEGALGVRGAWGSNCDWYLGYSNALTNKAWFEDNLRLELRWHF